jgi:spectinomycin phosphotransferase
VRTFPVGLSEQDLAAAVARFWGVRVGRLRYVPLGGGSYHWVAGTPEGQQYFLTVDDLHDKPWLGADPESVFGGLRAAFDTALTLRERAGLPFVVAPVAAIGGETVCRVTPRYSLALFPFVDGHAGSWGDELAPDDRDRLTGLLAELHLAVPAVRSQAPGRGMTLHERAVLETALSELGQPWTGGPFSELARRALAANAEAIAGWLASFDDLAGHVAESSIGDVITHGEPHPGNFIRAGSRILLIDWDTVALAPPERDLWMLDDGSAGALAAYSGATGRVVDDVAISFYRLAWTLAGLASFAGRLRSSHEQDQDTEAAWNSLRDSLRQGSSSGGGPYRHVRRQPGSQLLGWSARCG